MLNLSPSSNLFAIHFDLRVFFVVFFFVFSLYFGPQFNQLGISKQILIIAALKFRFFFAAIQISFYDEKAFDSFHPNCETLEFVGGNRQLLKSIKFR